MVNRIRKAKEERDQGFTLIELLVVIIIIGILAAIAIPVFLNQRKKGVDAGLKSDLKNAATQVETWATENPSAATVAGSSADGAAATPDTGTAGVADVSTDTALVGFKSSPGNTVKLVASTGTTGAYCLYASNAGASTAIGGTDAAGKFMKYDSQTGGISSTIATGNTACA